jgi:hypothetical protein
MISFFSFLHGLTNYNIILYVDDDKQLLKLYCDSQLNSSKNINDSMHSLEIDLVDNDTYYMDAFEIRSSDVKCVATCTKEHQNSNDVIL